MAQQLRNMSNGSTYGSLSILPREGEGTEDNVSPIPSPIVPSVLFRRLLFSLDVGVQADVDGTALDFNLCLLVTV